MQREKWEKHSVVGADPRASVFSAWSTDDYESQIHRARKSGFVYVDAQRRRGFILPMGSQIGVDQLNGLPCDALKAVLASGERMHAFPVRLSSYRSTCVNCHTKIPGMQSTST